MVNILVVGSMNMDVVNRVKEHPQPGETIHGLGTTYSPGGKGANQAVAASLAGGKVTMFGAVGQDPFGGELLSSLHHFGVNTNSIIEKEGTSGIAFITVNGAGENHIILSDGSNGKLHVQDISQSLHVFKEVDAVLLQNEIPWETTQYVLEEAARRKIHTYLNPAPAIAVPKEVFESISTLILNETEAELITGMIINRLDQAEEAMDRLINSGIREVVLTLGEKGCLYANDKGLHMHVPAFMVQAIDTTSAGDAFIGAFAANQQISSLEERLLFASAAAAISVTKEGAQKAIPKKNEVEDFLKTQQN